AIIAGADMVIELPTVFATANAELFSKGAIKILDSLNVVDTICFGVESGEKEDYISLAKAMNNESKEFKKILKEKLDSGISLAKAKFEALKEMGEDNLKEELISSPNNILGLEYTKALLSLNSKIEIEPLKRENTHNDKKLKKGISSALSIREKLKVGKIKALKKSLPKFVYSSITPYPFEFENLILSSVILEDINNMGKICDCTEGLENRIKALVKDNLTLPSLIEKVATKRYTETRIKRILISTFLKIDKDLIENSLNDDLYVKILAINKDDTEFLSQICSSSRYQVLTRKSDTLKLKDTALKCFNKDVLANDLYNLVSQNKTNENNMIII
ncbi:MAG: nucleotidyltransferase family protein, partial [Firmicutes bacterium]|nr:nucleotidyltransferase family protein [Candidatus Caballimonas caccae]